MEIEWNFTKRVGIEWDVSSKFWIEWVNHQNVGLIKFQGDCSWDITPVTMIV